MKLLLAHGWGFDRHFWEPLAALLPEWEHVIDDRGYFGTPLAPAVEGPCLAVTHSFGTMRVLADPPPGLVGLVAINGFERFTALPGKPGIPVRVVDRMLRRFEADPRGVLAEFRKTCGCMEPFGEIDPEPLRADLLRLRDSRPSLLQVPLLTVHGGQDPLLPADMREAGFPGKHTTRLHQEAAGHLLPLEQPALCAEAVKGFIEMTECHCGQKPPVPRGFGLRYVRHSDLPKAPGLDHARRAHITKAFGAASDYDRHAHIQRKAAEALAHRIAALDLPDNPRILEIGCGTGFLTEALQARGIGGEWLITDISPAMIERCRARVGENPGRRFAVLDGEHGTVEGDPFDLICSSLALQWFDDAPAALQRLSGWLAPDGHCLVATLGPGSFREWRAAHEARGLTAGTPAFVPVETFTALAPKALTVEHLIEHHDDARSFLHAVKAIGAGTAHPAHRPLSRRELRAVMTAFEHEGCEVTYEVVTCHLHRAR
ncbi:MAG: alpha/beta fold hydrolase [Novosphingobium sp.]